MPDLEQQETRDWDAVREAAIGAVSALGIPDPEAAADAVLAICDEEAVNRMAGQFVAESRFRAMQVREGIVTLDAQPAREIIAMWAGAARTMLGDAPNYVEMDISLAGTAEAYTFLLKRRTGKTPHQLRREAESEAAAQQERYEDLLHSIWLYIDWHYVTSQLTTGQKELFADAVDASSARWNADDLELNAAPADRWWRKQ